MRLADGLSLITLPSPSTVPLFSALALTIGSPRSHPPPSYWPATITPTRRPRPSSLHPYPLPFSHTLHRRHLLLILLLPSPAASTLFGHFSYMLDGSHLCLYCCSIINLKVLIRWGREKRRASGAKGNHCKPFIMTIDRRLPACHGGHDDLANVNAICRGCLLKSGFTVPHFKVLLGTSVLSAITKLSTATASWPARKTLQSRRPSLGGSAKRRATSFRNGQDERRGRREITPSAKWQCHDTRE